MKLIQRISLGFLVFLSLGTVLAQNPFALLDQLVNTEEHLIHMEEIGPYVLNADGQRLLHDPYLRLDIKHEGQAIPADSEVTVKSTLFVMGERVEKTYIPEYEEGRFVINPIDLERAQDLSWDQGAWFRMEISVDGPAGQAEETTGIYIYPPKLETGGLFRVINVAIPLLILGLFVLIYRFANVRIRQPASAS